MPEFFGWIPNIGGGVTSSEHLCAYLLDDDNGAVDGPRVISRSIGPQRVVFEYVPQSRTVKCHIGHDTMVVDFINDSGLATIAVDDGCDEPLARFSTCWILLRRELDGCSGTGNDCSAMDKVFSSKKNIYRAVLDGFIDNAEQITDSKNHVYEFTFRPSRIVSESRAISTLKTNSVYFRSFLNIYGGRIPSAVMDDYIRTYELRMEKFEAVTSDHTLRYSIHSSTSMLVLTGAALVTAVAAMVTAMGL